MDKIVHPNIAIENGPSEDVFPFEHRDIPLSCYFTRGCSPVFLQVSLVLVNMFFVLIHVTVHRESGSLTSYFCSENCRTGWIERTKNNHLQEFEGC